METTQSPWGWPVGFEILAIAFFHYLVTEFMIFILANLSFYKFLYSLRLIQSNFKDFILFPVVGTALIVSKNILHFVCVRNDDYL